MGGPTPDQIALIRQYEPALYFSGAPGAPGSERFFPSDAKRYLENKGIDGARLEGRPLLTFVAGRLVYNYADQLQP